MNKSEKEYKIVGSYRAYKKVIKDAKAKCKKEGTTISLKIEDMLKDYVTKK